MHGQHASKQASRHQCLPAQVFWESPLLLHSRPCTHAELLAAGHADQICTNAWIPTFNRVHCGAVAREGWRPCSTAMMCWRLPIALMANCWPLPLWMGRFTYGILRKLSCWCAHPSLSHFNPSHHPQQYLYCQKECTCWLSRCGLKGLAILLPKSLLP